MRADSAGRAQNNVVRAIGTVARRIGGTKEGDSGSAECNREMKRAGIAADDARRVAQESHQWTKRTIVRYRISVTAAFADGQRKIVFAGAVIHHAAEAKGVSNHFAELAEAFGRPTFRTPAAAGTQDDVAVEAMLVQKVAKFSLVFLRNLQSKGSHWIARSCAQREFTVLIGDVRRRAANTIGVEDGNAKFANRF